MAIRLVTAAALVALAALAHPATAEDVDRVLTLTVESPSFVSFQRQAVVPIPAGSKIRFHLGERNTDGSIPFRIAPEDVQIRAFKLGRDARGRYELAEPTTGTMTRTGDGVQIEFPATILAVTLHRDGTRSSNAYPVEFTTEESLGFSQDMERTVRVRGQRLDENSQKTQIVLATQNRSDAAPVPGGAVFAKITGTFDRSLRNPR